MVKVKLIRRSTSEYQVVAGLAGDILFILIDELRSQSKNIVKLFIRIVLNIRMAKRSSSFRQLGMEL
ncbi:hypothetical protein D3C75_1250870 [compost metagenome]